MQFLLSVCVFPQIHPVVAPGNTSQNSPAVNLKGTAFYVMYEKSAGRSEEEGSMWTQWTVTLGPLWSDNEHFIPARTKVEMVHSVSDSRACSQEAAGAVQHNSSRTLSLWNRYWRPGGSKSFLTVLHCCSISPAKTSVRLWMKTLCVCVSDHMIFYFCFHAKTHLIKLQLDTAEIQTVNTFRSFVTTEMEGWVDAIHCGTQSYTHNLYIEYTSQHLLKSKCPRYLQQDLYFSPKIKENKNNSTLNIITLKSVKNTQTYGRGEGILIFFKLCLKVKNIKLINVLSFKKKRHFYLNCYI